MRDSVTVVGLGFTNLHNMMSGIIVYELTQYTLTIYNFPLFPSSSAFYAVHFRLATVYFQCSMLRSVNDERDGGGIDSR